MAAWCDSTRRDKPKASLAWLAQRKPKAGRKDDHAGSKHSSPFSGNNGENQAHTSFLWLPPHHYSPQNTQRCWSWHGLFLCSVNGIIKEENLSLKYLTAKKMTSNWCRKVWWKQSSMMKQHACCFGQRETRKQLLKISLTHNPTQPPSQDTQGVHCVYLSIVGLSESAQC